MPKAIPKFRSQSGTTVVAVCFSVEQRAKVLALIGRDDELGQRFVRQLAWRIAFSYIPADSTTETQEALASERLAKDADDLASRIESAPVDIEVRAMPLRASYIDDPADLPLTLRQYAEACRRWASTLRGGSLKFVRWGPQRELATGIARDMRRVLNVKPTNYVGEYLDDPRKRRTGLGLFAALLRLAVEVGEGKTLTRGQLQGHVDRALDWRWNTHPLAERQKRGS